MALLLLFLGLALGVSFLCSILEAVLLSVTPSYIAHAREKGKREGAQWDKIKQNIDHSLAAILSLNTIAHTVGAAGVGAQAGRVFGEAYFAAISAILTLLILVVSEIIPKTLGANYWRQLAPLCARVLMAVEISMLPLVFLSKGITRLFTRDGRSSSISRDEIAALAWAGEDEGVLSSEESGVIRSIVRFRTLKAEDIMTPRTVIFALSDELSVEQVLADDNVLRFSRIPIYNQHPDKMYAFVRKDELLARAAKDDKKTNLKKFQRPLKSVLANQPLLSLLRTMSVNNFQVVLVVNEYGDILGLITMEDMVETMIGLEIVDETDKHPDMRRLARSLWERRAKKVSTN